MKGGAEGLYRRWIQLYDEGAPDQAMELAAPGFVMITPDGRTLSRDEAVAFTGQIKAYFTQMGLQRRTTLLSFHAAPVTPEHEIIYATVELALTAPSGEENKLRFVEVMHVSGGRVHFDAFSKLSESQSML